MGDGFDVLAGFCLSEEFWFFRLDDFEMILSSCLCVYDPSQISFINQKTLTASTSGISSSSWTSPKRAIRYLGRIYVIKEIKNSVVEGYDVVI